jgi:cellulose synthase/poly-beta-1,6-N-acetylglucosamine synthase-like glycosyltransferase
MLSNSKAKEDKNAKSVQALKWLLLYYPLRYILCASFIAYVLLNNVEFIKTTEFQTLGHMLHFFHISYFYVHERFFVGSIAPSHEITLPIYTQILFFIFFPTIAITSRTNPITRLKILSFGALCFVVFTTSQFLTIATMLVLGILTSISFVQTSIFVTIVSGSLIIELLLFSTLTLPKRTKIKSIIKRSYVREYACLIGTLMSSFLFMYFLLNFLKIEADSPILAYALLNLNITTIMTFSYFMSYFIYKVKVPKWSKYDYESNGQPIRTPTSISFLIAAYNEEKIIARCIESIDMAASKYAGKTEIIVVNDGSTDQTSFIVAEIIRKLKHSTGKIFTIPNSGKGFALRYGVERTSGDILFRIDADSILDEDAIGSVMNHFKDPEVGSVGGMLFPIEAKSVWQKTVSLMFIYYMSLVKRAQELFDSIIVQAGAYSVYRKNALAKVGGWADDQFGEDGELTNRMARFGYRSELELQSIVYTDFPESLIGLIHQRSRWNVAFYYSRGRNLDLITELENPRSIVFLINLISHGVGFVRSITWAYLAASIVTLNFSLFHVASFLGITKVAVIQAIIYGVELIVLTYYLHKYKKLYYIKCFPVLRLVSFILSTLIKPQTMEILLSWSCRWKQYSKESFEDLRKEVKRSVDPGF